MLTDGNIGIDIGGMGPAASDLLLLLLVAIVLVYLLDKLLIGKRPTHFYPDENGRPGPPHAGCDVIVWGFLCFCAGIIMLEIFAPQAFDNMIRALQQP